MAGWDRYLTEQDKQHIAISGKQGQYGLGVRPVILVIDVYYRSLGNERKPLLESIKDWPRSCGLDGWAAVDRMVGLLAAARAKNVPVVYTRGLSGFSKINIQAEKNGKSRNRGGDRLPGLANEIVAEVAPQSGDLVIDKTAPSAFSGTPLMHYLRMVGADTLIVCGEATSGCVRAAVVDGASYRYHVGIVGECCFDRTQVSHWISLFDMDQKYGDVIDVKTTTDYFATLKQ